MKTAVEWLVEQIINNKFVKAYEQIEAIEQAKKMEKQQMFDYVKNKYVIGEHSLKFHQEKFEKYYNETFKSK